MLSVSLKSSSFSSGCSDCVPKAVAPQGQDDEAAKKLWELSASMVGLL